MLWGLVGESKNLQDVQQHFEAQQMHFFHKKKLFLTAKQMIILFLLLFQLDKTM